MAVRWDRLELVAYGRGDLAASQRHLAADRGRREGVFLEGLARCAGGSWVGEARQRRAVRIEPRDLEGPHHRTTVLLWRECQGAREEGLLCLSWRTGTKAGGSAWLWESFRGAGPLTTSAQVQEDLLAAQPDFVAPGGFTAPGAPVDLGLTALARGGPGGGGAGVMQPRLADPGGGPVLRLSLRLGPTDEPTLRSRHSTGPARGPAVRPKGGRRPLGRGLRLPHLLTLSYVHK